MKNQLLFTLLSMMIGFTSFAQSNDGNQDEPAQASSATLGQLKVYPNPSDGRVNFSINGIESGDCYIRIVNVLGQVMYYERIFNVYGEIVKDYNFDEFPGGIYYTSIEVDGDIRIRTTFVVSDY